MVISTPHTCCLSPKWQRGTPGLRFCFLRWTSCRDILRQDLMCTRVRASRGPDRVSVPLRAPHILPGARPPLAATQGLGRRVGECETPYRHLNTCPLFPSPFSPGLLFGGHGQVDWDFAGWDGVLHRPRGPALWLHRRGDVCKCHPDGQTDLLVRSALLSLMVTFCMHRLGGETH